MFSHENHMTWLNNVEGFPTDRMASLMREVSNALLEDSGIYRVSKE